MGQLRRSWLDSFRVFNEGGGKFRLAVANVCNLDCFFCHNEAMPNPRRLAMAAGPAVTPFMDEDTVVAIADAYAGLGGRQINITGGEPLAHPRLAEVLQRISKGRTRVVLNSNVVLAHRLLARPRLEAIDSILASLHTVDDTTFRDRLGGRSIREVMDNIAALARHGYHVEVNYSLGPHNQADLAGVLDFALAHGIDLKTIALVRSSEEPGFYGGDWVDPAWIAAQLDARGARRVGTRAAFGGETTTFDCGGSVVRVKNVARGRLRTDFCRGCSYTAQCGEGIYGLRVGTDAVLRPCLLRRDRFRQLVSRRGYEEQILETVHAMVGRWPAAQFVAGAPE